MSRFTFGVALISRRSAQDWGFVQALLNLTLSSIRSQTDPDFEVVIAGHDRPDLPDDPRFSFVRATWPAERPDLGNSDAGRKKRLLNDVARERGGLFMFLDADDWIDVRLVEAARRSIGADHVGGVVEAGFATDIQSLRAAPIPHHAVFDGGFHRLCGSSTVGLIRPGAREPARRDPCGQLGSHHQWLEAAQDRGAALASLPVQGNYLINTGENHSERHGPYAGWRRTFAAAVAERGTRMDGGFAARFGVRLDQVEDVRRRFSTAR